MRAIRRPAAWPPSSSASGSASIDSTSTAASTAAGSRVRRRAQDRDVRRGGPFFEHIVREDRPPAEILFADYTFLNAPLAPALWPRRAEVPADQHVRVADLARSIAADCWHGRGAGVTSAPLRTGAVKRGDWVLRRVIGTPVPPPPADVGSIAADEAGGRRLDRPAALGGPPHRRLLRQLPLANRSAGLRLEQYDPLGRWREPYRDGKPIDTCRHAERRHQIADWTACGSISAVSSRSSSAT